MNTLQRMVFRSFLVALAAAVLFFVLILQLADVFVNLVRYLNLDVPVADILRVQFLYLPKTIAYALPVGMLFAVSFSLGNYYAGNELIAVFGAGLSVRALVVPIIIFGLVSSIGSFFFEEYVVIDSLRAKNQQSQAMLNIAVSYNNANVTILANDQSTIFHARYYQDANRSISDIMVVERLENGNLRRRINGDSAVWVDGNWVISNARVYEWASDRDMITETVLPQISVPDRDAGPDAFKRVGRNISELRLAQARAWIDSMLLAGVPVQEPLTQYYERFAFALTPAIVSVISSAIGGRFKKNVLLMSLLVALGISVVYYVTQMVMTLLSSVGVLPPIVGASATVIIFGVAGMLMLRGART